MICSLGHSMGGMGALQIYLKNQKRYKSCSAFAPIVHPSHPDCQWGQKCFSGYLGASEEIKNGVWKQYDPTCLVEQLADNLDKNAEILIDQGSSDKFLSQKQLQPEAFADACNKVGYKLNYRLQDGYDHGYYFISTFVGEHIEFHARRLLHQ